MPDRSIRHIVLMIAERQWQVATFQYTVSDVPVFTLTGPPMLRRDEALVKAQELIRKEPS